MILHQWVRDSPGDPAGGQEQPPTHGVLAWSSLPPRTVPPGSSPQGFALCQVHKFLDKNYDQVRQDVLDLFISSRTKVGPCPALALRCWGDAGHGYPPSIHTTSHVPRHVPPRPVKPRGTRSRGCLRLHLVPPSHRDGWALSPPALAQTGTWAALALPRPYPHSHPGNPATNRGCNSLRAGQKGSGWAGKRS